MKYIKIFLIVLSIATFDTYIQASPILPEKTLSLAKQKACLENKIIIMRFTAKWCIPCKLMDKNVFENSNVQAFLDKHAVIYKIDIDEQRRLKEEFKIVVLPTTILMKASGHILARKEESFNAESFISWVEQYLDENKDKKLITASTDQEEFEELITLELPLLDSDDFEKNSKLEAERTNINESKPTTVSSTGTIYHIQAGVFSNKENAEALAINLIASFNQEIKIAEETKGNNVSFKVRIGQFDNQDEAELFLQYMIKNNFEGVVKEESAN